MEKSPELRRVAGNTPMTDPIADMLTRIRNAGKVNHTTVSVPYSRIKMAVAQILEREGYLVHAKAEGEGIHRVIVMDLKYDNGGATYIRGLRRISKPGRRLYVPSDGIPRVNSGTGIAILSTSRGILSDKEARANKVGGEILCEIF